MYVAYRDKRNNTLWRYRGNTVYLFIHPGYAYYPFCGDYSDGVILLRQGYFRRILCV